MRRLLALAVLGAVLCTIMLPEKHVAHRTVDAVAAAAWNAGKEAVQATQTFLRERRERESRTENEDRSSWREVFGRGEDEKSPIAGRAALTDRLSARVDRRADRVAQNTPASAERSVERLATYLGHHAGPTKRGRTRAAFRWIADHIAYDTASRMLLRAEGMVRDAQSPATVLDDREAVCEGYARLFVALAEEMGLEAKLVVGNAAPTGTGGGGRHGWVVTRLGDGFYLLDPTWAAGYVTDGRFVSAWDEEWWLVPPEKFGNTHYPDDERWALGAPLAEH